MKTKIFLPVLTMLSLMLFSFTTSTTNDDADYSRLTMTERGNYVAHGVRFSDRDMEKLNRIENNFDELTDREYAAASILKRTLGPDWWEEEIVWDFAFEPAPGNEDRFVRLRSELDAVMEVYLNDGRR